MRGDWEAGRVPMDMASRKGSFRSWSHGPPRGQSPTSRCGRKGQRAPQITVSGSRPNPAHRLSSSPSARWGARGGGWRTPARTEIDGMTFTSRVSSRCLGGRDIFLQRHSKVRGLNEDRMRISGRNTVRPPLHTSHRPDWVARLSVLSSSCRSVLFACR